MKIKSCVFIFLILCIIILSGCSGPVSIKLLIVPKFEIGTPDDGKIGEGELYYREYLEGAEAYTTTAGITVYVKNNVAMFYTGEGKVNAAMSLASVLSDTRFDFSDAYILSTGCAGGSVGYSVPGDVVIVSDVVDYDLGHTADTSELIYGSDTWFHDESYDSTAHIRMNEKLVQRVQELTFGTELDTTEYTSEFIKNEYAGKAWAERAPEVIPGTAVTGDNYWKGYVGHSKAVQVCEYYGTVYQYAVCEMEDISIAVTAQSFDMLDRLIILRDNVNMDVFYGNNTPESLWSENMSFTAAVEDFNRETLDIFETAQCNNFKVGKIIADCILNGELQ